MPERKPRFNNVAFTPILICVIIGLLGIGAIGTLVWMHVNGKTINTLLG
jgi:hypothetical protein